MPDQDVSRVVLEMVRTLATDGASVADTRHSLIESGILDSFALIELVERIEHHFQLRIASEALTPENFETVERIAETVSALRSNEREGRGSGW